MSRLKVCPNDTYDAGILGLLRHNENNAARILIGKVFSCKKNISAWKYYRSNSESPVYVTVWRNISAGSWELESKTMLPSGALGIHTVTMDDPIMVYPGYTIGFHYASSRSKAAFGVCDEAVGTSTNQTTNICSNSTLIDTVTLSLHNLSKGDVIKETEHSYQRAAFPLHAVVKDIHTEHGEKMPLYLSGFKRFISLYIVSSSI